MRLYDTQGRLLVGYPTGGTPITQAWGDVADPGSSNMGSGSNHKHGFPALPKLDDLTAPDDNTDLDASITKHGLLPKLANDATKFLNGLGAWAVPVITDKSARVYHSGHQNITNASTTYLTFDSERWDTDNIHDPANSQFLTCKTAGKYLIIGEVLIAANATGSRSLIITLNATTVIAYVTQISASASVATRMHVCTIYNMAVNDFVGLGVYQDSGSTLVADYIEQETPEFMMARLA